MVHIHFLLSTILGSGTQHNKSRKAFTENHRKAEMSIVQTEWRGLNRSGKGCVEGSRLNSHLTNLCSIQGIDLKASKVSQPSEPVWTLDRPKNQASAFYSLGAQVQRRETTQDHTQRSKKSPFQPLVSSFCIIRVLEDNQKQA